jgi:hypothetical protein
MDRLTGVTPETARDIGEPGFDFGCGAGLVDAYAALQRLKSGIR